MPERVAWNSTTFGPVVSDTQILNSYYSTRDGDPKSSTFGKRLGYSRKFYREDWVFATEVDRLVNGPLFNLRVQVTPHPFSFNTSDRIIVLGCGFGFLVEEFKKLNYLNCWGVDNSAHIHANLQEKDPDVVIINEDMAGSRITRALQQQTGRATFDWVITERVFESFDLDSSLMRLIDAAEGMLATAHVNSKGRIIHLLDTHAHTNPVMSRNTIDVWRAQRPIHSWISMGSTDQLYGDWEVRGAN